MKVLPTYCRRFQQTKARFVLRAQRQCSSDSVFTGMSSTDMLETGWALQGYDGLRLAGKSHSTLASNPRFHGSAEFVHRSLLYKGE